MMVMKPGKGVCNKRILPVIAPNLSVFYTQGSFSSQTTAKNESLGKLTWQLSLFWLVVEHERDAETPKEAVVV